MINTVQFSFAILNTRTCTRMYIFTYEYIIILYYIFHTNGEFFKFVRVLLKVLGFSSAANGNLLSQLTQDTGAQKRRCNWLLEIHEACNVHNIRLTETGRKIALASAPKRQARGLCYSEGHSIRKGPNLDRQRSLLCTVSRNSLLHLSY